MPYDYNAKSSLGADDVNALIGLFSFEEGLIRKTCINYAQETNRGLLHSYDLQKHIPNLFHRKLRKKLERFARKKQSFPTPKQSSLVSQGFHTSTSIKRELPPGYGY